MRKRIVMGGAIVLIIGVVLFLASPYMFSTSISLDSLLPFKLEQNLDPNQGISLAMVPPGELTTVLYNDSAALPLLVNSTAGELSTENLNGTFAVECYNTGNAPVDLYLVNNVTRSITVRYSVLTSSLSNLLVAIGMMVFGALFAIGGSLAVLIGLISRPRPQGPRDRTAPRL
ncbi:MAG: hypothetical protein ACP5GO_04260 [Thermoprotei archaeon]